MKKNLKHIVNCLLLVFGSTNITYSQCIADAGENAALCTHWGLDTFYLGGAPTAVGGIPPYTYKWTCMNSNIWFTYTASDYLDDTTSANPTVTSISDNPLTFHLEVMDSIGATCTDSIIVQFSIFVITLDVKHAHYQQGDSARLYTSVGEGIPPLTYLWSPPTALTDPTDVHTWTKSDTSITYSLFVTDSAGCQIGDAFFVYVEPTSISEVSKSLYTSLLTPNPLTDVAVLSVVPFESIDNYEGYIYDLTGRLRKKVSIPQNGVEINRSEFEAGIYFYQILDSGKVISQCKFVVQ